MPTKDIKESLLREPEAGKGRQKEVKCLFNRSLSFFSSPALFKAFLSLSRNFFSLCLQSGKDFLVVVSGLLVSTLSVKFISRRDLYTPPQIFVGGGKRATIYPPVTKLAREKVQGQTLPNRLSEFIQIN